MARFAFAVLRARKAKKAMKALKKAMKALRKDNLFFELWSAEQQRSIDDLEARLQTAEEALLRQRDENGWMRQSILNLLERLHAMESRLPRPEPAVTMFV
jgi:hypothetical protein